MRISLPRSARSVLPAPRPRSSHVARLTGGQPNQSNLPPAEDEDEDDQPDKNAQVRALIKMADKGLTYGAMGTMFLSLFTRAQDELGGVAHVAMGRDPPKAPVVLNKQGQPVGPGPFTANNLLIISVVCYVASLAVVDYEKKLPRE